MHTIEVSNLTLENAIEHFAKYGYEYLYITENEKVIDVISYHEFLKYGIEKRKRSYIINVENFQIYDIEKFIEDHCSLNRIAVICGKEFLHEINLMTEPELLHSIERELFALRFLPLFSREVQEEIKTYRRIYVVAANEIVSFLKKYLPSANILGVGDIKQLHCSDRDKIIDYKYGIKLSRLLLHNNQKNRISLYSLIEKFALIRLNHHVKNKGLILKMCRIPDYENIKHLSESEKKVVCSKRGFLELINDSDYLKDFCTSEENLKFINSHGSSKSIRWDSGVWIVQGDCKELGIEITEGKRRIKSNTSISKNIVHFFGPCIVLGMLVINDETIPAYFAKKCIENNKDIIVENHGGLHGNNVLNSIIGALVTPTKKGDIIIIIDFFKDLNDDDYSQVEDISSIFDEKNENETFFLDHPVHCNSRGNEIIAEYLYKSIALYLPERNNSLYLAETMECDSEVDSSRYFTVAHAVGLKTKLLMKSLIKKIFGKINGKLGVFIIYDTITKEKLNCIVTESLTKCSALIIMYAFDHLNYMEQKLNIEVCESLIINENVMVHQLNPYFNVFNYGKNKLFGHNIEDDVIEAEFIEAILRPNNIEIRFYENEMPNENIIKMYKASNIAIEQLDKKGW